MNGELKQFEVTFSNKSYFTLKVEAKSLKDAENKGIKEFTDFVESHGSNISSFELDRIEETVNPKPNKGERNGYK